MLSQNMFQIIMHVDLRKHQHNIIELQLGVPFPKMDKLLIET